MSLKSVSDVSVRDRAEEASVNTGLAGHFNHVTVQLGSDRFSSSDTFGLRAVALSFTNPRDGAHLTITV